MKIQRTLLAQIRAHLQEPEITLVIGPRQAGKTTLLRALAAELETQDETVLFFNLDIDRDAQFFKSQSHLVERVRFLAGEQKAYIFLDEIQRLPNAGLFLKGLYDRSLPYKWVATGSGSLELKERIAESLVGRKRNFYLPTVSIQEYIDYATDYQYEKRLPEWCTQDKVGADQMLVNYLTVGGYPRVLTSPDFSSKKAALSEIFQGYIERDITALLKLEKSQSFVRLLQLLASRSGQQINFNDLAVKSELSLPTLKKYLWYSEKTFVTASVSPFFRNKEKEITKAPQYYFYDHGLRNFLLDTWSVEDRPEDFGFLFQQLVYHLLRKRYENSVASIHYWRTQNQAEVDFVVDLGRQLLPVEVKSGKRDRSKIQRSMHSFIQKYQPEEAWIITRHLETTQTVDQTTVKFKPWYMLLQGQ
jgi:predicted AAA+ superfamily ATPase